MAWTDPTGPNVMDFWTFCYQNGVPSASLPQPVLSITSGGSGYATAPDVTIDAPAIGVTMTATATISGGVVTALTLTNPGTNYPSIPNLTIAAPASGGTQATGSVTSLGSTWPSSILSRAIDRTIDDISSSPAILGELGDYPLACYNLGVHLLFLFAQDTGGLTFFTGIRSEYGLTQFRPGIMLASGDQATSQTFIVPKFFQEITLEGLEVTKTPWGRQWLEYEQMYGKTVWGMT